MKKTAILNNQLLVIFSVLVLVFNSTATAHHASAPHFLLSERVTVEGVITDFKLVNPHGYIYFDVIGENGKTVNWRCSLTTRARMLSRGWTDDMFKKGERVTMTGSPARREANHCFFRTLKMADGRSIEGSENITGKFSRSAEGGGSDQVASVTAPKPVATVPRELNDKPDISGQWKDLILNSFPGDKLSQGRKDGGINAFATGIEGAPDATEAGARAAEGYDPIYDDPALACHPGNIISALTGDSSVNEIIQDQDRITLVYGYMDLIRTFYLDQSEHPDEIVPSIAGHSIAWWEDDVLVVSTTGFEPGVLFRGVGRLHSDRMEVTERFQISEDGQRLTRKHTVHDPLYLKTDWVGETVLERSDSPMFPYNCISLEGANNQR